MEFYKNTQAAAIGKKFIVVHAGFDPDKTLEAQTNEDLFWIRDQFIMSPHSFNKTVVFGHTPFRDILFHPPYKIGIDTGLVYGNILSGVELQNRKIMQLPVGKKKVKISDFKTNE